MATLTRRIDPKCLIIADFARKLGNGDITQAEAQQFLNLHRHRFDPMEDTVTNAWRFYSGFSQSIRDGNEHYRPLTFLQFLRVLRKAARYHEWEGVDITSNNPCIPLIYGDDLVEIVLDHLDHHHMRKH